MLYLTHEIPPDFCGGAYLFIIQSYAIGPVRVYRVTQMRTGGVHCREYADTEPVVLKVVPVTGAAFSGITMDQLMCALSFPKPTTRTGMKWAC